MTHRSRECELQLKWKAATPDLSSEAREPGLYTGQRSGARAPFFLREDRAEENLLPATRAFARRLFEACGIEWHDGATARVPSNHLLDSMVACVNVLAPFAQDGRALATFLRPIVPDAVDAVAIEHGSFVAFEWIGRENYLKEQYARRRRGALGTSADAHAVLICADGRRVGVVIDWKYAEEYAPDVEKRNPRYDPFIEAADGPFALPAGTRAQALRFEPFYQLARTQLLAHRMERARESGVDEVVFAWVVPDGNRVLRTLVTSPELSALFPGEDVARVFRRLLRDPRRFVTTSPAALLRAFPVGDFPALAPAVRDAIRRYVDGR